jgi:uncharacterized protein YggU (UPF0235/DUF167 family)
MAAVRFVIAKGAQSAVGSLYLACHVKPGASSIREGVVSVGDSTIELCVRARAHEGEANKAVGKLIAEASSLSLCYFVVMASNSLLHLANGAL